MDQKEIIDLNAIDFEFVELVTYDRKVIDDHTFSLVNGKFRLSLNKEITQSILENEIQYLNLGKNKVTNEWYLFLSNDKGISLRPNDKKNRITFTNVALGKWASNEFKINDRESGIIKLSKNVSQRGDRLIYRIELLQVTGKAKNYYDAKESELNKRLKNAPITDENKEKIMKEIAKL